MAELRINGVVVVVVIIRDGVAVSVATVGRKQIYHITKTNKNYLHKSHGKIAYLGRRNPLTYHYNIVRVGCRQ